jgi:hypothetical protein
VTTPSAGYLFVFGNSHQTGVNCTPDSPATVGLWLDGTPVPGTAKTLADNTNEDVDVFGKTAAPVAAGTHTLTWGAVCDGASAPSTFGISSDNARGVILLGS